MPEARLEVVEVRVGRPAVIGSTRQGPVTSAIAKNLVPVPRLWLSLINLAGDDQADRSVHGGPDKSVYCYPSEHAASWAADGFDLAPGSVGENVVLGGAIEDDLRVGDTFRWGDAVVQISQPRAPCYKLTMHSGRKDIAGTMISTGRCGWYLRTLTPGEIDTAGTMELIERDDRNETVATTFAVMFPGPRRTTDDHDALQRVVNSPALAAEWIGYLRARNPLADGNRA